MSRRLLVTATLRVCLVAGLLLWGVPPATHGVVSLLPANRQPPPGDDGWCAPKVLFYFARLAGHDTRLPNVIRLCRTDSRGVTSLAAVLAACRELGLDHRLHVDSCEGLLALDRQAMVAVAVRDNGPAHVVGLLTVTESAVEILDPSDPRGPFWLPRDDLEQRYRGFAIVFPRQASG